MERGTRVKVIDAELARIFCAIVCDGDKGTVVKEPIPIITSRHERVKMDDGHEWWIPAKALKRVHRAKVEV